MATEPYRVTEREISVGYPLLWDVYDGKGMLLLKRGFVIESSRNLENLLEEGMFLSEKDSAREAAKREARKPPPPAPEKVEETRKPRAQPFLLDARRLLPLVGQKPESISDYAERMRKAAQSVDAACDASPDESIAAILVMQGSYDYSIKHQIDTAVIANLVARSMSLPRERVLQITGAALTMNISMLEVQDRLHECAGPLNDRLRALINAHPIQSALRLRKLGIADPVWLACVEQHHESHDGSGYPKGLQGEAVEVGARILGVADAYSARLTTRNSRRAPQRSDVVLREFLIDSGQKIDPNVSAHLFRVVGLYPPGTVVRLRNAEIAVVVAAGAGIDAPLVRAVVDSDGAGFGVAPARDTASEEFAIREVITLDKVDFQISLSQLFAD